MTVKIAFPLGEKVSDDRLEVSRKYLGLEVRKHPAFHGLQDLGSGPVALSCAKYGFVRRNVLLIEIVKQFRMLREHGGRQRRLPQGWCSGYGFA